MMGISESVSLSNGYLSIGSIGTNVDELQKILGILPNDKKFGPQTKKCVEEFQRQMHIKDDGIVGEDTKKYLDKLEKGEVKWNRPEFCQTEKDNKKPVEKKDNVIVKKEPVSDKKGSADVIFMAGLETVIPYSSQVSKLKNSLSGKKVLDFFRNDTQGVIKAIQENPKAYVILYSAACKHSNEIAQVMKNKSKLFIVEPYATSSGTANSVKSAVSTGVPSKNVITGPSSDRGAGVVSDSTSTPKGQGHFDALTFVSQFIV